MSGIFAIFGIVWFALGSFGAIVMGEPFDKSFQAYVMGLLCQAVSLLYEIRDGKSKWA